ncbi:ribonuclease T2 [Myriangium duriaei CBS 260.36]|uniref:ribonuclease T2 n=1 Tax=Myriangium duriaei CBS 260.36 TaxID=1168546 RepID=A0A9P4MFD9_9PEZI|nr:ribonuclease T2 [Myriangium duriaei CBS 260.36]
MVRSDILAAAAFATAATASLYGESNCNHTCALTNSASILSCSAAADPSKVDSCCVETFGGLFVSTQFWSTYTGLESQGQLLPAAQWTLHGLWPDFCNGSYTQYCDLNRQYDPTPSPNTTNSKPDGTPVPPYKGPGVDTFIKEFGRYDLLDWMNRYWINQGAPNADFWAHEFSKHATCYSTFDVPCYGPHYVPHQEVVEFYQTAITYYRRRPTYDWLAAAGIRPSNSTTYSLSDMQAALRKGYGALPYVGCTGPRYNSTEAGKGSTDNGRTIVDEMWYYLHIYGRPQDGHGVPIDATGSVSSCATTKGALTYPLRSAGSIRTVPHA